MRTLVALALCIQLSSCVDPDGPSRSVSGRTNIPLLSAAHAYPGVCALVSPTSSPSDSPSEFGEDDCETLDGFDEWQFEGGVDYEDSGPSGAAASSTSGGNAGGRPAEHNTDQLQFTILCESGATEDEIMDALRLSKGQVKRLKAKWQLHGVAEDARRNFPTLEQLQAWWHADPTLTTAAVANHAGVCVRALRQHFKRVGFSPHRLVPDDDVLNALRDLQRRQWCSNLGQTFAASALWVHYQVVARPRQLQRCLKQLDPQLRTARQAATARMGYSYCVGGPRSLYHCDAHEKLAKVWGF
jgi:hypothetical protein